MIETRKDSYFKCPTQLSFQPLSSLDPSGQYGQAKDFRAIAVTHVPPIWAVIFETESQEYFLAALDSENNQITIRSKLSLGWGTSRERLEIIFRQKDHFLVILERIHSRLTIVDVQETPQIVHRQVLNHSQVLNLNRRWQIRDLLIQNRAE